MPCASVFSLNTQNHPFELVCGNCLLGAPMYVDFEIQDLSTHFSIFAFLLLQLTMLWPVHRLLLLHLATTVGSAAAPWFGNRAQFGSLTVSQAGIKLPQSTERLTT
jgi:hypothetical protein